MIYLSSKRTLKPSKANSPLGKHPKNLMAYKSSPGMGLEPKRKRVNCRGGGPALMNHPAAVEAATNPDNIGECADTAGRPYSAAARVPVSRSAISGLGWTYRCYLTTSIITRYIRRFKISFTRIKYRTRANDLP